MTHNLTIQLFALAAVCLALVTLADYARLARFKLSQWKAKRKETHKSL